MNIINWTEEPIEVKTFISENTIVKMITEYFPDNKKKWTFYGSDVKDANPIGVFESFFDMSIFNKQTVI